jgi:hypothetical protein
MGEPLEVKDMASMLRLVVPLRSHHQPSLLSKLAPIEMAARSIQFQGPLRPLVVAAKPQVEPLLAHTFPSDPVLHHSITFMVPSWVTPAGYTLCGFGLALCNLIVPGYIQSCAQLLCPMWTLALALHTLCVSQQPATSDVWVWGGVLTILLLPFVIMIAAPVFVGFYLLVFAAFSSRLFWKRLQGVPFVLAWVCWAGLLSSCVLSVGVQQPFMHLSAATLFSISLGVLNSGGVRCAMRVAWDGSQA